MTHNTNNDAGTSLSTFDSASGGNDAEQIFRDLGIELSPLALEKVLTRIRKISDSDGELTEDRLRDIAAEATAGLEALDDVAASFR